MNQQFYIHRPCVAIAVSLACGICLGTFTDAPWISAGAALTIAIALSACVPGLLPGAAGTGRTPRLLDVVECGLKAVALRRIPPLKRQARITSPEIALQFRGLIPETQMRFTGPKHAQRISEKFSSGDAMGQLERCHGLARGAPLSRARWSLLGVHALFVLLGVVGVLNHRALRADDVAHLGYQQRQDLTAIEGVVASEPWTRQIGRGVKTSFELSVRRILFDDVSLQKRGKVLVNVFRKESLQYGDRIRLTGKLHRPFTEGFKGRFSYEDYLKRHGIYWVLSVKKSTAIELIEREKGNAVRSALLKVRRRLQDVLDEHLTVFESGVIQSLVLGGRYYIPERMRELFVLTGTAHILAISGMNVGGMAFLLFILLNVLRLPRRVQITLTCLVLVVYCLLTGANPSVVRATVMAVLVFGALFFERRCETLNSLGFAAAVILVFDPMALFDIGFQLSFAGVFFISWLYPIFYAWIKLPKVGGWGVLLVGAFCISLAAFVGVLPLIAYHFQMITPVSIVANIPIIPFVSVLFMLGVGIVVTGLIFPPAAFLFAASIKVVLYGLMWIVEFFSRCPGGYFYVEGFDFWMVIIYYAVLGAVGYWMSRGVQRGGDNEHVHFLS